MIFKINDIVAIKNPSSEYYKKMRGLVVYMAKTVDIDFNIILVPYIEWQLPYKSIIYTDGIYDERSLILIERPQLDLFDNECVLNAT